MLKFLCLFFIFVDILNALQLNSKFYVAKVSSHEENPYLHVKETKGKTGIIWKTNDDQTSSLLRTGDRTIKYKKLDAFGGKKNGYVYVKKAKGKTEIKWKTDVTETSSPIMAEIYVRNIETRKSDLKTLKNLCQEYEEGTFERNAQRFTLKAIPNIDECPIKKNSKAYIGDSITISQSNDNQPCVDYRVEFYIYQQNDTDNRIITGQFEASVTGC